MDVNGDIEIHETAFVTAAFRSLHEELSKDIYAKLWKQKNVMQWVETHLKEISSEEAVAHSFRNRYFLETLKNLHKKEQIEVLINFGCGFSMYPFLLDEALDHIEIDKPEVIAYKKSKIDQWQQQDVLPKRNISFIGVDFSKEYAHELLKKIQLIKRDKSCFILIEGVLFFLNKAATDKLFAVFNKIQNEGDYIGSVSFRPSIKETIAYQKLLRFLRTKLKNAGQNDYQTIEDTYYQTQKGYRLMDHQDYFSLSRTYGHTTTLEKDLILNENFYVLKKRIC